MLQRTFDPRSLIDRCDLALWMLYAERVELQGFMARLQDFMASDDSLLYIVGARHDVLSYESESFIPPQPDPAKPNLFFVVGNPAPQSVVLRAMYAHEGGGEHRQHRFWKVLHTTGVLRFSQHGPDIHQPDEKMRRLYAGAYESPFNVHIVPFFSLPSPPGGPWSGVAGLRRLFGYQFQRVVAAELAAVRALIDGRVKAGDCVLILQKDAYMALKQPDAPAYDGPLLRSAPISSNYASAVDLMCIPPTRLLYSRVTQSVLSAQVSRVAASASRV
ncbi:MAG: hypothetical protein ACREX8_00125 [Gammaproteobacteria bacterium]